MTLLNASASRSIILAKRPRNSSDFRSTCFISFSTASYFFFPIVRLQTIEQRADPTAPANAAALPPPGAGEAEASSSRNRETVCLVNIAALLDHIFDNFLLGFKPFDLTQSETLDCAVDQRFLVCILPAGIVPAGHQ